jgi:hypothetical protein
MEEMADANVPELFWEEGALETIISGTGSDLQDACNGFYTGLGSCQIAESFMRGFGTMLEAGTSMCYMSNFPAASSGVELVSGSYVGALKDIFDPPSVGSRRVKIVVGGDQEAQIIVARIFGQDELQGTGKMFRTELSFCQEGNNVPMGYDIVTADNSGKFSVETAGVDSGGGGEVEGGVRKFMFEAKLAPTANNKNILFDPAGKRTATVESIRDGETEKNQIIVNGGSLTVASRNEREGSVRNTFNKVLFAVNATGYANTRILSGAFSSKQIGGYSGEFDGAMQYQSPRYTATDSHPLLDDVREESFDGAFYTEAPSEDVDASGVSQCDVAVDAVVALDMGAVGMQEVQQKCEPPRTQGSLCWGDEMVRAAESAYYSNCQGNGGGPE